MCKTIAIKITLKTPHTLAGIAGACLKLDITAYTNTVIETTGAISLQRARVCVTCMCGVHAYVYVFMSVCMCLPCVYMCVCVSVRSCTNVGECKFQAVLGCMNIEKPCLCAQQWISETGFGRTHLPTYLHASQHFFAIHSPPWTQWRPSTSVHVKHTLQSSPLNSY